MKGLIAFAAVAVLLAAAIGIMHITACAFMPTGC